MFNYIVFIGIILSMVWLNFIFAMKFPILFFVALGINFYTGYANPDSIYFYFDDEEITTFDIMKLIFFLSFLNLMLFFFVFLFYQAPILMTLFVFINLWADYCRE